MFFIFALLTEVEEEEMDRYVRSGRFFMFSSKIHLRFRGEKPLEPTAKTTRRAVHIREETDPKNDKTI